MGIRCADHLTPLFPQKLVLTSPTGGGRSVGIVRSRTKATEFLYEKFGRNNESSSIWTIPDYLLNDVFRRYLRYDGDYFSLINNKFNDVYFYIFQLYIKQTSFSLQNFWYLTRIFRHTFETKIA